MGAGTWGSAAASFAAHRMHICRVNRPRPALNRLPSWFVGGVRERRRWRPPCPALLQAPKGRCPMPHNAASRVQGQNCLAATSLSSFGGPLAGAEGWVGWRGDRHLHGEGYGGEAHAGHSRSACSRAGPSASAGPPLHGEAGMCGPAHAAARTVAGAGRADCQAWRVLPPRPGPPLFPVPRHTHIHIRWPAETAVASYGGALVVWPVGSAGKPGACAWLAAAPRRPAVPPGRCAALPQWGLTFLVGQPLLDWTHEPEGAGHAVCPCSRQQRGPARRGAAQGAVEGAQHADHVVAPLALWPAAVQRRRGGQGGRQAGPHPPRAPGAALGQASRHPAAWRVPGPRIAPLGVDTPVAAAIASVAL